MPARREAFNHAPTLARLAAVLLVGAAAFIETRQSALAGESGRDVEDRFHFALGEIVFRKQWVSAPASTTSSDGLGPLYNARTCAQCHPGGERGQPEPDLLRGLRSTLVLRLSIPPRTAAEQALLSERKANVVPEPTYGLQLQPFALQGHRIEGHLEVIYEEVPVEMADGEKVLLRSPSYRVVNLGYGPLHAHVMTSARVAPPLIGLGLLELVPEEQILERENNSGDGRAGKASRIWSDEQGKVVLGRFGWKAGVPSLSRQVAEAFAFDLGISSSLIKQPAGDCTMRQLECRQAPDGRSAPHGGYELADALLELVTSYVANAGVRKQPSRAPRRTADGEALFHAMGCAVCHRPSLDTGTTSGPSHLRGRQIWPYTDLLLHDMGEGLADGRPDELADGRMWRTAPLWGVGRPQTPDGRQTFLHDGRARSLQEAILWHGGEAQAARDAFARLTATQRRALIEFLKSL
jgi:CxxC motif-containing protein (DUF1111 family)